MHPAAKIAVTVIAIGAGVYPLIARTQAQPHDMATPRSAAVDARQLAKFPEPMRLHTITSMRDHLQALQEINAALSQNAFEQAASIAEQRLGMSSLRQCVACHAAYRLH